MNPPDAPESVPPKSVTDAAPATEAWEYEIEHVCRMTFEPAREVACGCRRKGPAYIMTTTFVTAPGDCGRTWAMAFGRGAIGSVCAPDYSVFFADAVSSIQTACDEFVPILR